jgi:hypothetical protein
MISKRSYLAGEEGSLFIYPVSDMYLLENLELFCHVMVQVVALTTFFKNALVWPDFNLISRKS